MRAVWLREFGAPEVLRIGEAPDPVAGPGQVVVDVEFANITFIETQFRASGRGPFAAELPMIPGNGVGGVVASVGAGVAPELVGARVITSTGGSGGYAERVAVDANGLFRVPDEVAMDAAVALLADGRTATMMIRAAAIRPGERVLVEAAAGGVGSLIVQLARAAGARVVAAVGGQRKAEVARELGAPAGGQPKAEVAHELGAAVGGQRKAEVARELGAAVGGQRKAEVARELDAAAGGQRKVDIAHELGAAASGQRKIEVARKLGAEVAVDYTDDGWAKHVRDAVGAVDVVFDGVGGTIARTAFELLDRGGRMVSFGLASGSWAEIAEEEAAARGVTLVRPSATPAELRAYTESALTAAAEGRLRPLIGQRFPLADAAAAHAAIQSRATVGKTLLET
jgi:NADPH:quinone reductase-like Zn-dependent oxidoreductase